MVLKKRKRVAVLDVDGTMMRKDMKDNGGTPEELAAARYVREYFERHGWVYTIATAQTVEMIMSQATYEASVTRGFKRPRPNLGGIPGNRTYVPPEGFPCRASFTDPDIIMSMGTGCYPRLSDGYVEDIGFKKKLGLRWREGAIKLLRLASEEGAEDLMRYLAPIESEENYHAGITDVFPLDYRIQLEFNDPSASPEENEYRKNAAKFRIQSMVRELRNFLTLPGISDTDRKEILDDFGDIIDNLRVGDESRPPENHFQNYLMPELASKRDMVDDQLAKLSQGDMLDSLVIAGDMTPDLEAGCLAGNAKDSLFILVGGSPLSPYFRRGSNHFGMGYAGESLDWMHENLVQTEREGFELFKQPGRPDRLVIFGDIAYPGRIGPETIEACIKDQECPVFA